MKHTSTPMSPNTRTAWTRAWRRSFAAVALGLAALGSAHAQLIISSIPDSPDPVPAGGTVTYTVRVAETNGTPLTGGSFSFSVPANGQYAGTGTLPAGVSCSGMADGQNGPGLLSCSGIDLALNAVAQVPLRVRSLAQGTLSVTATPTPGGPAQSEVTTVNTGADLALSLTAPANASAGSTHNVVLTVSNQGPDASPASVLSYSIPPGFVLSGTPAGCSVAGSTLSCNLGAIAVSGTRTVTVTGIVGAGGGSTVTHTADIAAAGGVGDGVADNNARTANTLVAPGSALSVGKTKSASDPVATGTGFNFTLNPRYSGDYPAGVQVLDNVPAAFCFAGGSTSFTSGAWSCTASSQCPAAAPVISCTHGGGGAPGANVALGNIVVPVQAIATGSGVVNTASISAPGVTPADGSVATTVIDPVSDLRANKAKSWPQAAVPLNTPFEYTISTTNLGPTPFPASGTLTLTDNLPAGLQLDAIAAPAGFSCASSAGATFPQAGPLTVTCTSSGVALALNATTGAITLEVQATATGAALINNACVASASGPVDDNAPNNCASVGVTPQAGAAQADVSALKRVIGTGDAPANRQLAGQPITWEIEVVNAGPSTATDVAVTDVFSNVFNASPADYSLSVLAGAATMGSCSLGASASHLALENCTIASLPVCTPGLDCPRIRATVRHFGSGTASDHQFQVVNSAFVLAQQQGDPNLDNNNSADAIGYFLARTDVAVSKSDNPDPVPAGQALTYTITASNPLASSASRAYAVSVTDTLPIGVVFLSATPSGGGSCTTTPGAGATTTAGNRSLVCEWPSIARGGQETVSLRVRPLIAHSVAGGGSGSISNTVVVATTTPEIAGGAANNSATQATAVTSPVFDLLVNKVDDADPVDVGDDVTYTVTATNNGASTAENVVLTDTLPNVAGAPTFVSVLTPLPAGVSCDTSGVTAGAAGGSIVCSITHLGGTGAGATGEPASKAVQIRLRGADKGQYTNQASVAVTDPAINALDSQPANNTANQPTTFRFKADVQVVSKRAVQPGTTTDITEVASSQAFDWLVDVRNNGPQAAEITTFTDTLPAGLVLADAPVFTITAGSFTPAAISCTGVAGDAAVSCAIASMPANGTATVRIPVRFSGTPANGSVVTNTARIVTTGSGDGNGGANPNAGNNFNSGSVTVQTSGVSGRVYHDRNANGNSEGGEPGVPATVTLTGTDQWGAPVNLSVTSDPATGDFHFDVPPGSYTLTLTRPGGWLPGLTRAGSVAGAGSTAGTVPTTGAGVTAGPNGSDAPLIQTIVLGATGSSSSNNLFALVRAATLEGSVYLDEGAANGQRDPGEPGVAGATVALTGTDFYGRAVTRSFTTAADGSYGADDLLPGTYQLDETQPTGLGDGAEHLGSVGGVPRGTANPGGVNDRFGGIVLGSEEAGSGYDFGELGGELGGFVYVDRNGNGQRDAGEPGIAGVTMTLTGTAANGSAVNRTAITDASGRFRFEDLLPSDATGYTLTETQPAAYGDGLDSAGQVNGTPMGQAGNDVVTGIVYGGGSGDGYLFGEVAASLAGSVFNDAAGNGQRDPGDLPLAGVTLTLTGTDADGRPVNRSVTTGADGRYRFDDLPLSNGAGYSITQTQPPGYAQGGERAGSLGGSVAAPNALLVPLTTPGAQGTDYDFWERSLAPSTLSGTVWHDTDNDRQRAGGEPVMGGWAVELLVCADGSASCAVSDLIVLDSTRTAADGGYRFENLVPGDYQLRFRTPSGQAIGGAWPTDPVVNAPGGAQPTTPGMRPLPLIPVPIGAGMAVVNQDLPLDPSGIVYDSVTTQPVPGAVVEFRGPPGFDPAVHLLGGTASVTTAADGFYQYFLMPGAPAGEYTLVVTPPAGYINSATVLPSAGPLNAQTCTAPGGVVDPVPGDPCVVSTPAPVPGVASPYFLSFLFPGGGAQNVVNNHLPLDPGGGALIELRKTTPKLTVKKGELVPYVITARNTSAATLADVALVDTLPPGFKYVSGSLTVQRLPDGAIEPVVPVVEGRVLRLPPRAFAPSETLRLSMVLGVGTGVGEGIYVNQVLAQQASTQTALSNLATASVRVVPDALFDCTDVIGKVYDDRNANGYQDEGEPGLPNVRLATVNGLLVTTDAQGRYHIACAAVPKEGTGSNFVLKLDERTLPSGYRVTTENPASERATRGKFVKINFGTTVHRVVRLQLRADAFEPGGTALRPAFAADLPKAIEALAERPSVLRLAYRAARDEAPALGEARVKALKADLLERWRRHGAAQQRALFNLDIEVEPMPPSVEP
jgi:uncharacterized repeat protein (TIGR01451 family)